MAPRRHPPLAPVAFTRSTAAQTLSRNISNSLFSYVPPTLTDAYVRDGLNRYTSVAGVSFAYDNRQNLTDDGARDYTYDLENRLTNVDGASDDLALTYDPLGRLRTTNDGTTTTTFLYSGDQLVSEYEGSSLVDRYAFGAGVDRPITWYTGSTLTIRNWLHADELGSVIATSNGSGAATIYSYGPYGEPDSTNGWAGLRFRYTGQIMLFEAQLYHYKARVYDPGLGRFLQTDPVGYEDDLNLYAYVRNDPLNLSDPTGRQVFNEDGELNLTLSLGASATGVLGNNVPEGANLEGDIVIQVSINIPALLSSVVGDFSNTTPAVSIDRVGVQGTDFSEAPDVRGAMVDVDVGEVGVSLGTIADREGRTTTYQADVGPAGGEVFRPANGQAAGSGIRVSGYGPGLGAARTEGNTVTGASTPEIRRTDEERSR